MKKILISIDTEGDNQWKWKPGDVIHTENVCFLQRFQDLCESYGFIPTYLTNYEMAMDLRYQEFAHRFINKGTGEVGMHLHAWNTEPVYQFSRLNDPIAAPYLIEYPHEIMEKKIETMKRTLDDIFQTEIITHRAGRWAMNDEYFKLLTKYGYRVDCSVTPHINWSNNKGQSEGSKGSDYSIASENPYIIESKKLIEVPVTIRKSHAIFPTASHNVKSRIGKVGKAIMGQYVWLRPNGKNIDQMMWLLNYVKEEVETDYIMFILHSSEFMPGGSPSFRTVESIEVLYKHLNILFSEASKNYVGMSIGEYGKVKLQNWA